jgi:hypothetical protein
MAEDGEDLNLQIVNVIKMGSNSVQIVSNYSNKGIDIALMDGSLVHLKSKKLSGDKNETMYMDTYKYLTRELPYLMGIHPKNMLILSPFETPCIEKLAKNDLLSENAVRNMLNLSIPLQQTVM